jgi:hypothetical protein
MAIQLACTPPLIPTKVGPFGIYGAGLWTGHPMGLVIVFNLFFYAFVGLSGYSVFLALAVPPGAGCEFFHVALHRTGLVDPAKLRNS